MRSVYPFRYEERAAIIEYCGNKTRLEAEQLALEQQGLEEKYPANEINTLWQK